MAGRDGDTRSRTGRGTERLGEVSKHGDNNEGNSARRRSFTAMPSDLDKRMEEAVVNVDGREIMTKAYKKGREGVPIDERIKVFSYFVSFLTLLRYQWVIKGDDRGTAIAAPQGQVRRGSQVNVKFLFAEEGGGGKTYAC